MNSVIRAIVLFSILALISCKFTGRTRPMIIGHRGDSDYAPENTIPAFIETFTKGGDGFETDLRTSKDGYIVLVHDYTLDRTTNCSTTAPEGQCRCGPVDALTLAELKTCDAGSWFGPEFEGLQIPTFEEALEIALAYDGFIVMDLKTDDQSKGLLGEQILPLITEYNMQSNVVASCWTEEQSSNMATYLKSSIKQRLGNAPLNPDSSYFTSQIGQGVTSFSLSHSSVTNEFVYKAHKASMPVYVWTVNSETAITNAMEKGVDGVLSDDVALCVSVYNSLNN